MAKNSATNTRSNPVNLSPTEGGNNLLAAWQGIYHLFGGRGEFRLTSDGVFVDNFTTDSAYDPETIVRDISHRNRQLDLIPTYLWAQGEVPALFTDAKEITQYGVQYFRGAVEEGSSRTPKYLRDAASAWKTANEMARKRGRKKRTFSIDNLSELNAEALTNVDVAELERLREIILQAEQLRANQPEPEMVNA